MENGSVIELINKWKLNKRILSDKINMPVPTFQNKINSNQPAYHFTASELQSIRTALKELREDIDSL